MKTAAIAWASLASVLLGAAWCGSVRAAPAGPNVILIVSDDQHREQANFLPEGRDEAGRPKTLTPNIDRLAREGVVLAGLHSPSPLCVPSRFALLTGNYASRATNGWMRDLHKMHGHTFIHQEPNIVGSTPTLAKDLKRLGYATGMVGKNHAVEAPGYRKVDARWRLDDPRVQGILRENQAACAAAFHRAGFDFAARFYHTNPRVIGPPEIQAHNLDWVHEAAIRFIDARRDQRFFLYYAVTVPHGPHNGWKSDPRASPAGILPQAPRGLPSRESIAARLEANGYGEDCGDMLWLDDCVGALTAQLERHGILDNTVIVYLTDHGVEGGKTTCYQGGMRTLGFVWGPPRYVRGGRAATGPCSLVDIAPTVYDLCGGTIAAGRYDGVSLRPLLAGGAGEAARVLYGEMGHTRAVIKGRWKYIALRYSDYIQKMPMAERLAWLDAANEYQRSNQWTTYETNDPRGGFGHSGFIPDLWDHEKVALASYPHFFDADQLYDLAADPKEQHNLADDPRCKDVLLEMQAELRELLKPLPGGFAEFKAAPTPPAPMPERIGVGRELMKTVFH